jgi:hypothetical protein
MDECSVEKGGVERGFKYLDTAWQLVEPASKVKNGSAA